MEISSDVEATIVSNCFDSPVKSNCFLYQLKKVLEMEEKPAVVVNSLHILSDKDWGGKPWFRK